MASKHVRCAPHPSRGGSAPRARKTNERSVCGVRERHPARPPERAPLINTLFGAIAARQTPHALPR